MARKPTAADVDAALDDDDEEADTRTHAARRLENIIQRIERIEEEMAALRSDKSDMFAEAKSSGFDPSIIRAIVKRRRMEPEEREEFDALLVTYEKALGL